MKNIFKIILLTVLLFNMSCSKFLDINYSPNDITDPTLEMVLPTGIVAVAYDIGGRYQVLGGIWAQHYTSYPGGPQYQSIEAYNVSQNTVSGPWGSLYTGALTDLEWVKNEAEKQENWNYYLIATAMQCYTYQVLVDLYDEIPFTDALQKKPPKYDNAEIVYDGLITRLDDAINKYKTLGGGVKPQSKIDVIFGGDMDNWLKFANTLKLKIYLRQTNIRPSVAENGIRDMYSKNVQFLDVDAKMTDFVDQTNHSNPFYETEFKRFGNVNICASKTAVDFLNSTSDPRIGTFYTQVGGNYVGNVQGNYRVDGAGNLYSAPNVAGDNPVYLISAAESNFLQAEAIARGWGTGDAQTFFISGIGDGNATYPNGTLDENIEAIITQKWVSMINKQGLEAFFEHNRTGYPDFFEESITSVLTGSVKFPQRLMFPQSESERNSENVPTLKHTDVKVWWAK